MGSAESACLENATPNQKSLVYSKSRGRQGAAMVSEVVAIRSRGCEKTVNWVDRGNYSSLSRQPITADFSRTQSYIIIGQTHFSRSDGWSLGTRKVLCHHFLPHGHSG